MAENFYPALRCAKGDCLGLLQFERAYLGQETWKCDKCHAREYFRPIRPKIVQEPLKTAPEASKTCLQCHEEYVETEACEVDMLCESCGAWAKMADSGLLN